MTTAAVPQHLQALERANELRFARAAAKRDLHAGRASIADVIDLECVQSMRVAALLSAQFRWGTSRARDTCRQVPCSEFLAVRDLTARQRDRLLDLVA